ncbi:MAG: extracellular solute-binding protein [Treponema sp.]|jgi:multiple sugar transport system substrate-binding protein|nr:extracellular solute-binding protein [Treponema sp.]
MKRVLLTGIALAVIGISAFASGGNQKASSAGGEGGQGAVRWSYWGSEARIKNNQLIIDKFTEQTGIIVASEPAPGTGDHFTKFKTQFAGGNAADIVQLGGDFSNLQVNDVSSVLLPLDDFVKSGIIDTSKVDKSAITEGTMNGKLYALPLAANMPALVYNKSLLERAGAPLPKISMTWAEFDAWLAAAKARLPDGVYPLADNSANSDQSVFFGYWQGQNGTTMWDGQKSYTTAESAKQYFDLWADWRAKGYIPDAATAADYPETNESSSSLVAGKVAVAIIWSNQLLGYQNATQDTLDLIELPNAAVTNGLWGQMSQMMAINKNSKNAEAAAKFINYRVNEPSVWVIMGADPGTPVNSAARAALPVSPITDKVNAYLNVAGGHTRARDPNMPGDSQWNSRLYNIAQNVAFGRTTTAQAGQEVVSLIAELTR